MRGDFIPEEDFRDTEDFREFERNYPILVEQFFISEDEPLKNALKDIIENVVQYRVCYMNNRAERTRIKNRNDEWNDFYDFVSKKFPQLLDNILTDYESDLQYNSSSMSLQYGNFPHIAWEAFNSNDKFYPAYMFKPNSGVYLTLCLNTTFFISGTTSTINQARQMKLFRNTFENIFLKHCQTRKLNVNIKDFFNPMNLSREEYIEDEDKEAYLKKAKDYEISVIFAKYYDLNNLPDDDELKKDLFEFLKIYEFAKKHEIYDNVEKILNSIYYIDTEKYDSIQREFNGENKLFYGVPGSGKSWYVENKILKDVDEQYIERILFHPDYTYSDFVGQILPNTIGDQITYDFIPGPFTTILKKAYADPNHKYYLIIEEINRGNAPAIFGDIFQLLDRRDEDGEVFSKGFSEYGINNSDIAKIVYGEYNINHKIRIPSNLSIIATMNTSDQNVFTLDTAFKRRWTMKMIENSFDDEEFNDLTILETNLLWRDFCNEINKHIVNNNISNLSSEDKRIGAHFVDKNDFEFDSKVKTGSDEEKLEARLHNNKFAEKVLMYLWDDALKLSREEVFDEDSLDQFTLEFIVNKFNEGEEEQRFSIFTDKIRENFKEKIEEYKQSKERPRRNGTSESEAVENDEGSQEGLNSELESTEVIEDFGDVNNQNESTEVVEGSEDE